MRPRLEEELLTDPEAWEQYAAIRGRFLEEATADILSRLLGPGSKIWPRLEWSTTATSGELDILATQDQATLRVQCKAGRMTAPALRGGIKRMETELKDLVGSAADQHRRLEHSISQEDAAKFTEDNDLVLEALTGPALQFEIIVTLENLGLYGSQMLLLEGFGTLPHGNRPPFLVSLNDLRVIGDLLDSTQFVGYLAAREKVSRSRRIFAQSELDYLGSYLSDGLDFDHWLENYPGRLFTMLSFTDDLDSWYLSRRGVRTVDAPKPARQTTQRVAELISLLKDTRPDGWLIACMSMLLWSAKAQEEFDGQFDAALARALDSGGDSVTFEFDGSHRFTMAFGYDRSLQDFKERLDLVQGRMIEERGFPLGIAVGKRLPLGPVTVSLVSSSMAAAIERAFLAPPDQRE